MSATPNKNPPTYCRTGVVRGSYVKVFTPTINQENGKAEYSMTLLIQKEDVATMNAIKAACKAALQKKCGLEVSDVPVFGLVSRLAEQKGLDLLSGIADEFLSLPVQFVLLGEGDAVYHTTFQNIGKRHPKNTSIHLGFDAMEAHQIYAGSDFFLMPSYFEPCGLGQMISMRYGTMPIVRKTGGLADTVTDADDDSKKGTGFVFEGRNPDKLFETIKRAVKFFEDKKRVAEVRQRGMSADFSWDHSAKEYERFYTDILNQ
jgi:starch synthase